MLLRSASLLFAVAALAVACGDDDTAADSDAASQADAGADALDDAADDATGDASGADAPSVEPLTMPEWCQRSNELWCNWMFECFSDADMTLARQTFGFDNTIESCRAVAVASCQNRTIPAVNEGRQLFDGAEAASCVAALVDEPCASYEALADGLAFDPPACADVTVGTRTQAQTCEGNNDCAAVNARCIEGICTGRLDRSSYLAPCDPSQVTADVNCPGLLCLGTDPDDRTAGICTHACTLDQHCGEGAECFRDNSGDRFCLATCRDSSECGQFECVQASPEQFACISGS